jgi:hypothetical protein
VLVDGGEEEHLRRYINAAYSRFLRKKPLHCDALVVTHGDAGHFAGLVKLIEGFRSPTSPLVTADRVFRNGLVKKTGERISEAFGATAKVGGATYAVQLEDNLLEVPDDRMNRPFKSWKQALKKLEGNSGNLAIRRLQYGDNGAFDFLLPEEIVLEVLGPMVEEIQGKPALRFLRSSEERLVERARNDHLSLAGEVFKVPHHGSADFSPAMFEAVRPVVSVVSSGDECTFKEYIHPLKNESDH